MSPFGSLLMQEAKGHNDLVASIRYIKLFAPAAEEHKTIHQCFNPQELTILLEELEQ